MVYTPHLGKSWLWETSGHLGFYKESMYPPMEMDKADYYVKPMNCPFHIMIYNNSLRSYRDLPCRWAELGTVYRYEKAGALHGLLRVRGFTQDDAHLFCTPEQMDDEIEEVLRFSLHMLRSFGFTEIHAYISTRPEKSVGDPALWDSATVALTKAVEKAGLAYDIDEGGGAFYGPKIDLKIKDAIGREWQLSTVQFDFNLPQRFKMTYVDKDGTTRKMVTFWAPHFTTYELTPFDVSQNQGGEQQVGPLRKAREKAGIAVRNRLLHFPAELLLHIGDPILWNIPVPRNTTSFFSHKRPLLSAILKPVHSKKIKD